MTLSLYLIQKFQNFQHDHLIDYYFIANTQRIFEMRNWSNFLEIVKQFKDTLFFYSLMIELELN